VSIKIISTKHDTFVGLTKLGIFGVAFDDIRQSIFGFASDDPKLIINLISYLNFSTKLLTMK